MGEFKDETIPVLLGSYKHIAKLAIERKMRIDTSSEDSINRRVDADFLHNELIPHLEELGEIVYGFITSYNDKPENFPSYSTKDVLDAQLALDDVTGMLRSAGITVIFRLNGKPV